MGLKTLNDVFFSVVDRSSPRVAVYRHGGQWLPISSQEYYRSVAGVSRALSEWGIAKGDRVAILSENRPEWTISDFAALLLGAVVVPIYPTLTAEQTAYILQDSGARAVFVSSEVQLQKVLAIQPETRLERLVLMDSSGSVKAMHMEHLMRSGPGQRDPELEARARAVTPDDLATIIYTSGTTGVPKGAMLTHGNMAANLNCSLEGFDIGPDDVCVSFLPLSHVTARHLDFTMLNRGAMLAYVSFLEHLPQALLETHPTVFVGVPRVYEKIYSQTEQKTKDAPKRWIYHWAVNVGKAHQSEILLGQKPSSLPWKLAARLVYSQIRAGLGGRVRIFISGGAPLGRELAEWYASVGIRIHEGYGLTETSPVIALNKPKAHKLGTVGKPLSNVETRIAEDGELLVKGPSVFKGYWKRPDETQNAFADGWFKTGDIGDIDRQGFLSITDRKKDLIKTSGGKFIAPQPIENSLKHNPLIAEALVLGDKRKFPAVMIVPNFPLLEDWARRNGLEFSSRQDLVRNPQVQSLYDGMVQDLNHRLARFEQLKKFLLLADEFSIHDGTLTASMKLRRRAVQERYRTEIDKLYGETELPAVS